MENRFEQVDLFDLIEDNPVREVPDWEKHWQDMPECKNVKQKEPLITVTFKFETKEDFEKFNSFLKDTVYKTNKVFDGMQRKTEKQAWFPLKQNGRGMMYE